MKLTPSPFAPARFPDLPVVKGVRAATGSRGFYAARGMTRDDVFLFSFEEGTHCAGVYTLSHTASADVIWCREALKSGAGKARALIANSGNSNAFTGAKGVLKNEATLKALTDTLGVEKQECFLAATGVIGEPLPDPNYVGAFVPDLAGKLSAPDWEAAARAFMTTDTFPKGAGLATKIDGVNVNLAGIAKGSGMIAPDMATMLVYIFTDAVVSQPALQKMLSTHTDSTFNCITVDSDTSTSDSLILAATGASGVDASESDAFSEALHGVMLNLAHQVVQDGEGATKFVEIAVTGAATDDDAKTHGMAIANSPLIKTAIAGEDPNWGRVVMAVGKSGAAADRDRLSIRFGDIEVAKDGWRSPDYSEEAAAAHMKGQNITIGVDLGLGDGKATVWTCDLTHGYIEINADYRS
ncbi:MAG TPA: bifunctional ornithine acetyltransferase/N-acetylglutamate synthase [Hyphomonas sp.]|nr:bifunctional ornithine acetyltransferase/N-acetylglutamate synthase [Hyphomonas sp.]